MISCQSCTSSGSARVYRPAGQTNTRYRFFVFNQSLQNFTENSIDFSYYSTIVIFDAASLPFLPVSNSNCTRWPSLRLVNPEASTAVI